MSCIYVDACLSQCSEPASSAHMGSILYSGTRHCLPLMAGHDEIFLWKALLWQPSKEAMQNHASGQPAL